jgi:hypothetical protein
MKFSGAAICTHEDSARIMPEAVGEFYSCLEGLRHSAELLPNEISPSAFRVDGLA